MERNILLQMLVGSIPILPKEDLAKNDTVHPMPNRSIEHPYPRGNVDVLLDAIRDMQIKPSTLNRRQFDHGDKVVEECRLFSNF